MKLARLKDVIGSIITGEWGVEGNTVQVLRTTNFRNDGSLNFDNVVYRNIKREIVEKKKLRIGDIIIERSGGGPKQPVGRVVYYNLSAGDYLCNNFTSILRPSKIVDPRYLFYFMYNQHKLGVTQKFQNKTTGIINLKLDNYLSSISIPLPSLDQQTRIAHILDSVDALRQKDKELLAAYDDLLQAAFLDIFGDPLSNSKGWKVKTLSEVISHIDSGWSPKCEAYPKKNDDHWGVLSLSAVTSRYYQPDYNKQLPIGIKPKINCEVNNGDLLFSRKNTRELVGACAYVFITPPKLMLSDTIFRINYIKQKCDGIYLYYLINSSNYRKYIQSLANGSSGSMPNISKEKLGKVVLPIPPMSLQNQFAQIVTNIEAQKALAKQNLQQSEEMFNALVQKAFNGELL